MKKITDALYAAPEAASTLDTGPMSAAPLAEPPPMPLTAGPEDNTVPVSLLAATDLNKAIHIEDPAVPTAGAQLPQGAVKIDPFETPNDDPDKTLFGDSTIDRAGDDHIALPNTHRLPSPNRGGKPGAI